jgi:hypothetical protein
MYVGVDYTSSLTALNIFTAKNLHLSLKKWSYPQNKWVILGQELTVKTTLENREFDHNARSATSWFSLVGSSFDSTDKKFL